MKRRSNLSLWAGFLLALGGFLSYFLFFTRFESTRDFPWVNLLLFAAGGWLLGVGLKRAFQQPESYRGKVAGPVLAVLSAGVLGFFLTIMFHHMRQLPASTGAPRVGSKAPDFSLEDQRGKSVSLAELLQPTPLAGAGNAAKSNGALLIFYRGYW